MFVDAALQTSALVDWVARFTDQAFTPTDAVSFAAMRGRGITTALTFNRHFSVAGFEAFRPWPDRFVTSWGNPACAHLSCYDRLSLEWLVRRLAADPDATGADMDLDAFLPLSPREFHILLAIAAEPRNGYQISQLAEENSRGAIRLSPATQYTNLHRLVGRGLVHEVTDEVGERTDGRGQRYWALTRLGSRVLHAEGRRLAADAGLVRALGPEEEA